MLADGALASTGFNQHPALVAKGGLYQRGAVTTGFAWLTALALHTLRLGPGASHSRVKRPGQPYRSGRAGQQDSEAVTTLRSDGGVVHLLPVVVDGRG